jgi:hypothetical protein
MRTKTHFAFRVDIWDADANSIVEHVAGVDDFEVAEATSFLISSASRIRDSTVTSARSAPRSCSSRTRSKILTFVDRRLAAVAGLLSNLGRMPREVREPDFIVNLI